MALRIGLESGPTIRTGGKMLKSPMNDVRGANGKFIWSERQARFALLELLMVIGGVAHRRWNRDDEPHNENFRP